MFYRELEVSGLGEPTGCVRATALVLSLITVVR